MPQHSPAQFRSCSQETGLYSRYGDPQNSGQIIYRHFFYVAHYQYFTQQRRNATDLRLQHLEYFQPAEFTLGIAVRSRQLGRYLPTLGVEIIQMDELCQAPLADQHQALVLDYP